MCTEPGCMEFLMPAPAAIADPVCPVPGCGNQLDPDGTCPLHNLDLAAEADVYADPARFQLDFPFGPIPIGSSELRIGRSEEFGAIAESLRDYDKVSRQHAVLWIEDGDLFVRDLGSTNGTFVNDRRLTDDDRRRLQEGDEVRFASVLRVRVRRSAAA